MFVTHTIVLQTKRMHGVQRGRKFIVNSTATGKKAVENSVTSCLFSQIVVVSRPTRVKKHTCYSVQGWRRYGGLPSEPLANLTGCKTSLEATMPQRIANLYIAFEQSCYLYTMQTVDKDVALIQEVCLLLD